MKELEKTAESVVDYLYNTLINLSIASNVDFYLINNDDSSVFFKTKNIENINKYEFIYNSIDLLINNMEVSLVDKLYFIDNIEFEKKQFKLFAEFQEKQLNNKSISNKINAFKKLVESNIQVFIKNEVVQNICINEYSGIFSDYKSEIINDFILPIFVKDCKGKYIIINNKFKEIANSGNAIGSYDEQLFGKELAEIYTKNDKIILKQNKPILFEEPYIFNNENKFALVLKYPLYGTDAKIQGIGGIVIDITQQKEVEEKYKQREILLNAFIDNLPFDIWVVNKKNEFVFQNNLSKNRVGDLLGKKFNFLQSKIEKENFKIWNENNKLALNGYTVKKEFETTENKQKKYFYSVLTPVYKDSTDNVELIIGVNIDWTDKKNTENALSDALNNIEKKVEERTLELFEINKKLLSHEKLLHEQLSNLGEAYREIENMRIASENQAFFFQQILDSIEFPISVTDINKNWTFVNKATAKFIGKNKNDLIGLNCNIWGDCNCNENNCGVERLKRGENSFINLVNDNYYRINTFYIKNLYDVKIGHVEFIVDVTEQKNAELQRIDSENKFKTAFELSPIPNVIIDKNSRNIVDANQSFSNLIHRYKLELLGNSIYDFLFFAKNIDKENFNKLFDSKILNNEEISFVLEDKIIITALISSGLIDLKNKEHLLIAINNINERKLLENKLFASKVSFENVFNNVFDALFIHEENGLIIDFNQRAVEMFKISKNNKKQLSILEDFSTANNQGIVEGLWKLIISGKNQLVEWKVKRHEDGVEFWTELYLQKIKYLDKDVVISSVRDITERKKMELILKESEEKFKHSVASIQDALIIINNDTKISYWNPAAEKITGFTSGEVLKKPLKYLLKFLNNQLLQNDLFDIFYYTKDSGVCKVIETEIFTKANTLLTVEINISSFKIRNTINFVAVIKDLSKHKQAEEEINKSLQKEKELNYLKSGFISTVSHEFRTPLSGIISNVYMLEKYEDKLDITQKNKCFNRIHYATSCISLMIDDITLMHKDQSGKLEFKPQLINFEDFCEKLATETFANYGLGREIRIKIQTNFGEAYIDSNLLKHIIVNLITNAIKYSNNEKWIEFEIYEDNNENAKIIIKDYGIGIGKDELKFIFEPFYRGNNVNVIQGSGLGLSIVKRCVEIHKGGIHIASELGVGTEVIVNIPIIKNFI